MARFVLVHGAWHGGWCWEPVQALLQARGHEVHAPTLTGLGERSHLMSADITPDTHVADIVQILNWRNLSDVILVGHSYGGMVITGVASQVPDKLRALIYLDAFVPEVSQRSVFADANPARMEGFRRQIEAGAIGLQPDAAIDTWTDDPDLKNWLLKRCTPQPKGTLEHGVTLTGRETEVAQHHYIIATKNKPSAFWAEYQRVRNRPGWTSEEMATWHDAMLEAPKDLTDRLHRYAAQLTKELA